MAKESRYRESSRLATLGGSLKAGGRAGRDLQKSAGVKATPILRTSHSLWRRPWSF